MNIPVPSLMRVYGTDEVFFKKASGGDDTQKLLSKKLAGVVFTKIASAQARRAELTRIGVAMEKSARATLPNVAAAPIASLGRKTIAQAPLGHAGVPPIPAQRRTQGMLSAPGHTQMTPAVAPPKPGGLVLPGASKPYDPFDKATWGHQKDETGVPRAQRKQELAARMPPSVQAESSRKTQSALQAPGQLTGPRVQTGALMGPPPKPGATQAQPLTAPNPADFAKPGIKTRIQEAITGPKPGATPAGEAAPAKEQPLLGWKTKAKLLGGAGLLGAGYLGYKALEAGKEFLEAPGPGGYGYAPGGYQVPMGVNQYGQPQLGTPLM